MRNELITEDRRDYEDEIDLVDLIKLLIRNKSLIIMIFVIITIISGVGSYIVSGNRKYNGEMSFMYKANVLETRDDVEVYSTE